MDLLLFIDNEDDIFHSKAMQMELSCWVEIRGNEIIAVTLRIKKIYSVVIVISFVISI